MCSNTLNNCLNALDIIWINVQRSCIWSPFKLTCLVDLLYLMCVRGRCAGEVLCGQGHTGSWWHHDQTDAPQTGTAEHTQLAAGWCETQYFSFHTCAGLSALLCHNFSNSCLEKILWRLCNLVPATPQRRLAGSGPASKSPELGSCSRRWDRCCQLTVFRLKKSNMICNFKVFLFNEQESLFIYVSVFPVCGQTTRWKWKLRLKLLFIYLTFEWNVPSKLNIGYRNRLVGMTIKLWHEITEQIILFGKWKSEARTHTNPPHTQPKPTHTNPHTPTHTSLHICHCEDFVTSPALYSNSSHPNETLNLNLNPTLNLTLNPSLNPDTDLLHYEDQPPAPCAPKCKTIIIYLHIVSSQTGNEVDQTVKWPVLLKCI